MEPTPQETPRYFIARFMIEPPYFTYLLLGILGVIHLYSLQLNAVGLDDFYLRFANISVLVKEGEYYRLFSSMFLHAGLAHIIFNGMALYIFGREIEGPFGHVRFLLIYVLGGLTGSLASVIFTRGFSVGASGAIFALFGAAMAYYAKHRKLYGKAGIERLRSLATLAVINLMIGFLTLLPNSSIRIDNAAHIGGLLGGLALGWLMVPLYERRIEIAEGQIRPTLVNTQKLQAWIWVPVLYSILLVLTVMML